MTISHNPTKGRFMVPPLILLVEIKILCLHPVLQCSDAAQNLGVYFCLTISEL